MPRSEQTARSCFSQSVYAARSRFACLALSWIGTGRLIFSLNYTEADCQAVADRFVAAAEAMQHGGWWWDDPLTSNRTIKRRILREMIAHRLSPRRAHRVSS